MTYSKKQKEYSIQYAKDNLKRIPLDVKRDYYNNVVKIEAKKRGISVRSFILQAIKEKIERDNI